MTGKKSKRKIRRTEIAGDLFFLYAMRPIFPKLFQIKTSAGLPSNGDFWILQYSGSCP